MSTVTRIKGTFDNKNLPVLTEEGLMNYYVGTYFNKLKKKGYTLSAAQKNALTAFIETIADSSVMQKIETLYLFIGDTDNPSAVGVPLLGNAELPLIADNISVFNTNKVAVSSIPSSASINMQDITSVAKAFNVGISQVNLSNLNLGSTDLQFIRFLANLTSISQGYGHLLQRIKGTTSQYQIYNEVNDSVVATLPSGTFVTNGALDIGNIYTIYGLGGSSSYKKFQRYMKKDDVLKFNVASNDTQQSVDNVENKNLYKLYSTPALENRLFTSMAFFNDILSTDESAVYMDALSTLNKALGREISL